VTYTFRNILASAALACLSVGAQASVLTFEDVPLSTGRHFFLADYHGFTFGTNNINTNAWFYTDEITPFYTPSSPTHFIATDYQLYTGTTFEATQSITSAVDFIFNGAWFTGQDQIRYQLYNNGSLVHTSADSLALNDSSPIFVNSGYTGLVDEVVILGTQGFYALDDFTYNEGTGVPEPTSLALVLLAGAVGVGATRRRAAAAVTAA
jgi:hypothetical protein